MKIKRTKRLLAVTSISLLVAGCGQQVTNKTQSSTEVLSEDVKLESALADGRLAVDTKPEIEIEGGIPFSPEKQPVTSERITYNKNGQLYSLDLQAGAEQKVADREVFTVSENGKWGLSFENEEGELYVHNLQNGDMKVLENASPDDTHFLENDVFYRFFTTEEIVRVDPETSQSETWDMSQFEYYSLAYMAKEKNDIYIAAESEKDGYGIYELKENGVIEHIRSLAGEGNDISDFSMLKDGAILFQGTFKGKEGIFYWGPHSMDVQQVISGGEDQEGKWISYYNLSPDQSKILYDMPVQVGTSYKSDIYMAELDEGKLVNTTRIMESTDLYNNIAWSADWREDSKTAYIKTMLSKAETVHSIAVFEIKE